MGGMASCRARRWWDVHKNASRFRQASTDNFIAPVTLPLLLLLLLLLLCAAPVRQLVVQLQGCQGSHVTGRLQTHGVKSSTSSSGNVSSRSSSGSNSNCYSSTTQDQLCPSFLHTVLRITAAAVAAKEGVDKNSS
jgi:hypothetical protein